MSSLKPDPKTPAKPDPNTYWVLPGRFLAGSYPAGNQPAEQIQQLTSFIKTGLDSFVDLTSEGEKPPYQSALVNLSHKLGLPASYQRFPIADFSLPSRQGMTKILDHLDALLAGNHNVYLHCYGGIGRTGTVVACYLVRHGLSGQQALSRLADLYAASAKSLIYPHSPETEEQRDFILNWHEP